MNFLKTLLILFVFTQTNAKGIDCFYYETWWTTLSSVYQCNAKINFIVDSDQNKVTNVTLNHKEGKTNNDVDFLYLGEQNLTTLPKGIEKFFPNLKGINLTKNKVKVITKNDLKVFPSLQWFCASNDITTLDDDLFSASPNLKYVSFRDNKIKHIGLNTFKPLTNLQYLSFSGGDNCVNDDTWETDKTESLISKLHEFCPPEN